MASMPVAIGATYQSPSTRVVVMPMVGASMDGNSGRSTSPSVPKPVMVDVP